MSLLHEIRYAVRTLMRVPSFTASTLVTLALGIGVNTALFSVMNVLTLRSLPVANPDRLYQVRHAGDKGSSESASYALYEAIKSQSTGSQSSSVSGALLFHGRGMRVVVDGNAEIVHTQFVTGDYFKVLGVSPRIGRLITGEDEHGAPPNRVAVISDAYWEQRFGRDPDVLGRSIAIDQTPHTIVGVTRPEFFGLQIGRRIHISVPIDGTQDRESWLSSPLLVRLAPGVAAKAAEGDVNNAFSAYVNTSALDPQRRAQSFKRAELVPAWNGLSELRDSYMRPLTILMSVVGLLLLLACTNLSNLTLVRATARQREVLVRIALGASRGRIARQLLLETFVLTLAGGALALLVAMWAVGMLIGFLPENGLPLDLHIDVDRYVLLFTFVISLVVAMLVGVAPTWLASRLDLREALAQSGRSVAAGAQAFGKTLIVVQVAMSLLLLVGATLFGVSLRNLKAQDAGFDGANVLLLTTDANGTGFDGEKLTAIHRQILDRLRSLPDVERATLTTTPPLSGHENGKRISIPGFVPVTNEDRGSQVNEVGPDYFDTFRIPILRGRPISASDREGTQKVAVVSESMARHFFPGQDPIGRRMDIGRGTTGEIEIVGIAKDVKYRNLKTAAAHMIYVPFFQREAEGLYVFAVRTSQAPMALERAARAEIQAAAPAIPLLSVKALMRQMDETLVNERLLATMGGIFAGLALLLAGFGIYGVVAYSVARRVPEMGIRMALGADRGHVIRLVLRSVMFLVITGLIAGLGAAVMASRLISGVLYGVAPREPWVYVAALILLAGVAVLATLVPALRASRVQPATALWYE